MPCESAGEERRRAGRAGGHVRWGSRTSSAQQRTDLHGEDEPLRLRLEALELLLDHALHGRRGEHTQELSLQRLPVRAFRERREFGLQVAAEVVRIEEGPARTASMPGAPVSAATAQRSRNVEAQG